MGLKTPIPHLGTPPSPILHPKPTDFPSLTVENASGCGYCDCSEEIDGEFQCPCARLRPGRSGFSEDVGGITEQGFGGELSPWDFFDMVEVDSSGSVSEFGGGAFLGSGGSGFFMCFLTGVKQFQFKQRSMYEFRYRIVNFGGHSPEDVTAVLSSSDKKIMTNMKEIMKRY